MKKLLTLLGAIFFINTNAQVCFTSTNYTVGNGNDAIASADFNSDGKLDLAISSFNGGFYLLFGDGFGGFTTSTTLDTTGLFSMLSSKCIISKDFNMDGKADIAATIYGNPGVTNVVYGDGAGNFPTSASYTVGSYPMSICSGDFNGDGKPDLATANSGGPSSGISILLNNGSGGFNAHVNFSAGDAPISITTGDFNGDTKVDLAVANHGNGGSTDSVAVLLGNGSGSFGAAIKYLAGSGPYSVSSKDFNTDGYEDIVVANSNSNDVSVLLSQGASGLFNSATNYPVNSDPWSVVSADFNGDGKFDIATSNYGNSGVSIFLGNGTGGFGLVHKFSAFYGPVKIITADFNNDGKPDLATADYSSNNVTVLLDAVAPYVSISSSNSSSVCSGTSTTLTASGATTYTWSANAAVSNPNYTVTTAVVTTATNSTYTVWGAENGCKDSSTVTINVTSAVTPNICMVTTDAASGYNYNIVYWDKSSYTNVDSFIIYRQVSLNYVRIGAVSKNALSEFQDTAFSIGGPNGGNPQYSSWSYKLAIKDTCGNIGAMSPYHQTMFVQENNSNFSWNAYTVESGQANPLTNYSFLRDDNNTGTWHVLVNTSGISTTDPNYSSYPNGNWRIDANGFNCTPTLRLAGNNNNTQSTYVNSHSNTTKPVAAGINKLSNNTQLKIYPNPANNKITIDDTDVIDVRLFDVVGKQISNTKQNQIDVSNLQNGVYFIQVQTKQGTTTQKIIVQH